MYASGHESTVAVRGGWTLRLLLSGKALWRQGDRAVGLGWAENSEPGSGWR
jgi:hypothetical protein